MNLFELSVLYAIGGMISAVVLGRRGGKSGRRSSIDLLLALLLWPLWLPVALTRVEPLPDEPKTATTVSEQTLEQAYEAVKGTPLEKLLPRETVDRISREIRRVVARDRELSQLLGQPNFNLEIARARVVELTQCQASSRALAMAQRHVEDVERLAALHARDRLLVAELGDWLSTLRTQLVLARYSASSAEGVGDIFAEVCARVEVLGSTLEEPSLIMPDPPPLAWPNTFS